MNVNQMAKMAQSPKAFAKRQSGVSLEDPKVSALAAVIGAGTLSDPGPDPLPDPDPFPDSPDLF